MSSSRPWCRITTFIRSSRSATFSLSRAAAAAAPFVPGLPSIASSAAFTPFHSVESCIGISALTTRSVKGPCPRSSVKRSGSASVEGSHFGSTFDGPACELARIAAVPGSGPPYCAMSSSSQTAE